MAAAKEAAIHMVSSPMVHVPSPMVHVQTVPHCHWHPAAVHVPRPYRMADSRTVFQIPMDLGQIPPWYPPVKPLVPSSAAGAPALAPPPSQQVPQSGTDVNSVCQALLVCQLPWWCQQWSSGRLSLRKAPRRLCDRDRIYGPFRAALALGARGSLGLEHTTRPWAPTASPHGHGAPCMPDSF